MQKTTTKAFASLSALLLAGTLAGCGGGGSNNNNNDDTVVAPAATLVGLRANGVSLRTFSSQSANIASSNVNISGLQGNEVLVGIDYRYNPLNGGATGLYGVTNQNRLYLINTTSGAATQIGNTAFAFTPASPTLTDPGFDFNPVADRIRLVQGTFNARLNETVTTGNPAVDGDATTAGTQPDGTLAYATGDANAGRTPNIVGAAYTNNVAGTTSTVNYAIDADQDILVTQGRPDNDGTGPDTGVSPNTGQLFTVGALGVDLSGSRVSFEISGTSNNAFMVLSNSSVSRLYVVNLTTGRATRVRSGTSSGLYGVTAVPTTSNQ